MFAAPLLLALTLGVAPDAGFLLPAPSPFQSRTEDPLLAPVPRPPRELKTWDEALTELHQHSSDERTAAAAVERAAGRWRQSLGLLLPNARATASAAVDLLHPTVPPLGNVAAAAGAAGAGGTASEGQVPTVPLGTASLAITQSLVDVGAWHGLTSSGQAKASAQESLYDVRRRLTLGLARALVAVVAAERVAELNRLGLSQALERSALTRRTQQLGAATQVDVVRVQQDVELARGALIFGDEALRRTREALGATVGLMQEVGVAKNFQLDGLVKRVNALCKAVEPSARPDVASARANAQSATLSRRQAAWGYAPALGLTSSLFGYTTTPGPGRFATWNLAAVLSVPLWEGGTREGLVKERAGIEAQAQEQVAVAERAVAFEVARARRGVGVAQSLLSSASRARELAERLDTLTRRSFEVGRGSSLELVQSAAALRQADVALATREYELVQASLDAFLTEARCDG